MLARTDRYDMDLQTVGCNQCGLAMTNPQPTAEALDLFYRDHYRDFYQKTATASLQYITAYRKHERAAETVAFLLAKGALPPAAAVLDIGASEGAMLRAVRDAVPRTNRVAVEPNVEFGRFAAEHAECRHFASLQELRHHGETRFDLIILNHVYEHVKNPVEFLTELHSLVADSGYIYIDVPDIEEYRRLDSLHIAHLYHFGGTSLALAAARAGFEMTSIGKHAPIMHPQSLRCLLRPRAQRAVTFPADNREGWRNVVNCDRHAFRYHRRRWSLLKRIAYRWTRRHGEFSADSAPVNTVREQLA